MNKKNISLIILFLLVTVAFSQQNCENSEDYTRTDISVDICRTRVADGGYCCFLETPSPSLTRSCAPVYGSTYEILDMIMQSGVTYICPATYGNKCDSHKICDQNKHQICSDSSNKCECEIGYKYKANEECIIEIADYGNTCDIEANNCGTNQRCVDSTCVCENNYTYSNNECIPSTPNEDGENEPSTPVDDGENEPTPNDEGENKPSTSNDDGDSKSSTPNDDSSKAYYYYLINTQQLFNFLKFNYNYIKNVFFLNNFFTEIIE